jgi:hypothetical protein
VVTTAGVELGEALVAVDGGAVVVGGGRLTAMFEILGASVVDWFGAILVDVLSDFWFELIGGNGRDEVDIFIEPIKLLLVLLLLALLTLREPMGGDGINGGGGSEAFERLERCISDSVGFDMDAPLILCILGFGRLYD